MARTRARASMLRRSLRAACQPMATWSSCIADDGNRVDTRRSGQSLELGDEACLRVLRDHQAGVDARIVGQEGRKPGAARDVKRSVTASFRHGGNVSDGNRQEVEHVADRSPVEVAAAGDSTIESDDGVVDGSGEFAIRDCLRMGNGVQRGPMNLRRAPQRVGVLHASAFRSLMAGDDGRVDQQSAKVAR